MAAEQLFQIGIKGLIRDAAGKILLLKIPAWGGSPDYWDMPGGRMEPGETFQQTLRRELSEEISVDYTGTPKPLMTVLSPLTIPVGDQRIPLVLIAYEVDLPHDTPIILGADEAEEAYGWLTPAQAAHELLRKYPQEFCDLVATL
jgi:8-oxo-dGTP pyrophosphatase MutT (NUDIX family)